MTSGITSSYSTIQEVSENPDTPKPSENENGREAADASVSSDQLSDVSPGPSHRKESKPPDNENEKEETDNTANSNPLSSKHPGPAEEKEIKEGDDFHLKDIKPPPRGDRTLDVTASPVPQPRTKMNIHQTDAVYSTDDLTKVPRASPDSTKPPPLQNTYVSATDLAKVNTLKNAEVRRSSSFPRPARPPPPARYYGRRPSTPKSTMSSDNDDGQDSSVSSEQSPVSPGPSGEQGPLFGTYRSNIEDGEKPAIPPRPPLPKHPYASSASLTSQGRPPPPSFDPPPPPSDNEPLYNEIQFPAYLHILPEHDNHMTPEKMPNIRRSAPQQSSVAVTQEILEMLKWLKVASKTDYMSPSLYGVSLEEEVRSFHHTAMNLKKALRLYNLLMMKRSELLRNYITELNSTSNSLDKALKREKTIQLAGGTTGAVGGVTAVVGLALAPVTFGASLIATVVGAGMAASAGGVSARAAKANKKIITRDGVDRLIIDYTEKVKDIEHCLNFILSGMNELRRYDIARLQRAGAQADALKIAHLTQSVFNNMDSVRRNSVTQAGGMSSERLLQGFAKELDFYFTEKEGQKLKKSRKSRFSGRVRLLAENLQDELDYLNHMWELFN